MRHAIVALKRANIQTTRVFETLVRLLLSLLLLSLLGAMAKTVYSLATRILEPTADAQALLQSSIVHALGCLAVLEVYKTAQTYFVVGRVKVTYALDTVLVVLLTEVLALWFGGASTERLLVIGTLIICLVLLRIPAIEFSPDDTASRTDERGSA